MTLHRTKALWTPWAIILLFVSPSSLVRHVVEHAIQSQPGHLSPDKELELRASFTVQFKNAIDTIRSSLFSAFFVVAFSVVGACIVAAILKGQYIIKTNDWNAGLQFGGIGVLLWATLGRAESAIQTLSGGSIPERIDFWLYRILYVVSSFALTLAVAW